MSLITIDAELCKRDGLCSAVCPFDIISLDDKDSPPQETEKAAEYCYHCGQCVAVCPHGALSLQDMPVSECIPVDPTLSVSPEQVRQMFRMRRSIRNYKDKPVESEIMEDLLRTATYAPSGHNTQPTNWMVFQGASLVRLRGLTLEFLKQLLEKMPEIAIPAHVPEVIEATEAGHDKIFYGAPTVLLCHAPIDQRTAPLGCVIALAHFELAATASGLGTCWMGYFNYASEVYPPLKEELALPEGHKNYGALSVGYPKFKYHRIPLRRETRIVWR